MHARITRFDVRVEDIEKLTAFFNGTVVPAYAALAGYKGALSFADRTNGKWESITFWDSEASLQATDQTAKQLRETAKRDFEIGEMTIETAEVQTDKREPALDQQLGSKQPAPGPERTRH